MRRALLYCAAIAFAIACGDGITEPVPPRTVTPPVSFATTTTEDGLSISTDKDDYQPGDTVHFAGSGWQAGDVLDIVLTDDPLTHDPHTWSVNVEADGMFHDSTYVVDEGDLNVTFTLVAMSRATGRSLTVVFTDGNIGSVSFTFFPGGSTTGGTATTRTDCTGAAGTSVVVGSQICARASFNIASPPVNATEASIRWINPSGTVVAVNARSPDFASSSTGAQSLAAAFTPTVAGTWTVLLCESNSTSTSGGGAAGCTAGPERGRATFVVRAITFTSFTFFPGGATSGSPPTGCTGASGASVASGTQICARADFTLSGNNSKPVSIRWRNSSNTVVDVDARSPDFAAGTTGAQTFAGAVTPSGTGAWTALLCESSSVGTSGVEATGCPAGTERGSAAFTVTEAGPTKLAFPNPALTGVVGECLGAITVETQNASSVATNVTSNTTVNLTTDGAGSFFSNSDCTTSITSVAINLGSNSASFYYKATAQGDGSHLLTASAAGLTPDATQTETIEPALANKLVFSTTAFEGVVGECLGAVTVQTQNASDEARNVISNTTVELATDGTGGFFSNSNCTTSIESIVINAGSNSASFYYKATARGDGTHDLTASATGLTPATQTQTINRAPTSTAIKAATAATDPATSSVYGEPVTFTATVTVNSPGSGTLTGDVTFKVGGTSCSTATPLSGTTTNPAGLDATGKASFQTAALNASATAYTIRACYEETSDFGASTNSMAFTVNKAQTSVALTKNPTGNSVFSQSVTFTATVSVTAPGAGTPGGGVKFYEFTAGGTCDSPNGLLGTETLNGSAEAQFSYSDLPASATAHTITACYQGSTNFAKSGNSINHTVDKASTKTTVVSSENPSVFSQSVTFTATVEALAPAVTTPSGSVTFHDGAACTDLQIGASKTLISGVATSDATTGLSVSNHTITACYAETANFKESNGNVSQIVNKASTTTAITTSGSPSVLHQPVTFTATVEAEEAATATPDGSVTFHDGAACSDTQIGAAKTLSGGSATSDATTGLSAGNHTITACYAENGNFKDSHGSVAQQVRFDFVGLAAPVDRPNTFNLSKAGQAIPLKWQLLDFYQNPVTNLSAVTVKATAYSCTQGSTTDMIEEYASGSSGLQNLGGGYYQFNWKTPTSYALSCKTIGLDLAEGFIRTELALFTFKK